MSMRRNFLFTAPATAVDRHQLALLHIKLLVLVHRPFVVAVATQGIALVFFLQGRFAKGNDVSHTRISG